MPYFAVPKMVLVGSNKFSKSSLTFIMEEWTFMRQDCLEKLLLLQLVICSLQELLWG